MEIMFSLSLLWPVALAALNASYQEADTLEQILQKHVGSAQLYRIVADRPAIACHDGFKRDEYRRYHENIAEAWLGALDTRLRNAKSDLSWWRLQGGTAVWCLQALYKSGRTRAEWLFFQLAAFFGLESVQLSDVARIDIPKLKTGPIVIGFIPTLLPEIRVELPCAFVRQHLGAVNVAGVWDVRRFAEKMILGSTVHRDRFKQYCLGSTGTLSTSDIRNVELIIFLMDTHSEIIAIKKEAEQMRYMWENSGALATLSGKLHITMLSNYINPTPIIAPDIREMLLELVFEVGPLAEGNGAKDLMMSLSRLVVPTYIAKLLQAKSKYTSALDFYNGRIDLPDDKLWGMCTLMSASDFRIGLSNTFSTCDLEVLRKVLCSAYTSRCDKLLRCCELARTANSDAGTARRDWLVQPLDLESLLRSANLNPGSVTTRLYAAMMDQGSRESFLGKLPSELATLYRMPYLTRSARLVLVITQLSVPTPALNIGALLNAQNMAFVHQIIVTTLDLLNLATWKMLLSVIADLMHLRGEYDAMPYVAHLDIVSRLNFPIATALFAHVTPRNLRLLKDPYKLLKVLPLYYDSAKSLMLTHAMQASLHPELSYSGILEYHQAYRLIRHRQERVGTMAALVEARAWCCDEETVMMIAAEKKVVKRVVAWTFKRACNSFLQQMCRDGEKFKVKVVYENASALLPLHKQATAVALYSVLQSFLGKAGKLFLLTKMTGEVVIGHESIVELKTVRLDFKVDQRLTDLEKVVGYMGRLSGVLANESNPIQSL